MTIKSSEIVRPTNGTAAEWTSANPILLMGERGIETDTGYVKVGDGVTEWNDLGYFGRQDQFLHVQDRKASGTDGGTFSSGSWQTRDLNTIVINNISGASLSANQIILPQGKYLFTCNAPAYRVNRHKIRLRNITDATTLAEGTNGFTISTDSVQTRSFIQCPITLSTTKNIELQHRCQTTNINTGLGADVGTAFTVDYELYTDILIKKIN